MSLDRRVKRLEQAAQPAVEYEILWAMSSFDFRVWAGQAGTLSDYLDLMSAAGLLWLADSDRIIAWLIDVGDGRRFESRRPVVRVARYTPRGGWGKHPMIKIWDLSTQPSRQGQHVSQLEQPQGDPWPPHWPRPRLPLALNDQEAGDGSDR